MLSINLTSGDFMRIHILILLCSFASAPLLAREETLSITDNDDNNEVYNLVVNVDETTQSLTDLYKDTFVSGKKIRRDHLNPLDLKTQDGVILEKRDKYNVLNLKSDNLDYDRGGKILIDTLYNGVTGDRRQVELELSKDKNSWKLFKEGKSVSKFHVHVNKVVILGTVGIKTIVME
jgi:site-specific DNA-adenine methylase